MGLNTVDLGRFVEVHELNGLISRTTCVQLHSAAGSTRLNSTQLSPLSTSTSYYRSFSSSPYPSFPSFTRGPKVSDVVRVVATQRTAITRVFP